MRTEKPGNKRPEQEGARAEPKGAKVCVCGGGGRGGEDGLSQCRSTGTGSLVGRGGVEASGPRQEARVAYV